MTADKQKRFEADLVWLAKHEQWSEEHEADVRGNIARHGKPAIRFWWCLAKASKAGYRFDAESGYEKLHDFCARTGMPGPTIN